MDFNYCFLPDSIVIDYFIRYLGLLYIIFVFKFIWEYIILPERDEFNKITRSPVIFKRVKRIVKIKGALIKR